MKYGFDHLKYGFDHSNCGRMDNCNYNVYGVGWNCDNWLCCPTGIGLGSYTPYLKEMLYAPIFNNQSYCEIQYFNANGAGDSNSGGSVYGSGFVCAVPQPTYQGKVVPVCQGDNGQFRFSIPQKWKFYYTKYTFVFYYNLLMFIIVYYDWLWLIIIFVLFITLFTMLFLHFVFKNLLFFLRSRWSIGLLLPRELLPDRPFMGRQQMRLQNRHCRQGPAAQPRQAGNHRESCRFLHRRRQVHPLDLRHHLRHSCLIDCSPYNTNMSILLFNH